MAFIKIAQIKGGAAGCFNYFFKDGVPGVKCSIDLGEVAYVPDDSLSTHMSSELVVEVSAKEADGKVVNPEDMPAKANKNQ